MDDTVNWLFFDLNAYFASVEQQENPALRGVPVAVVPVMTDSTCCIAASYEARPFGIKTGTLVGEARALCPSIRFVEGRQDLYVAYHHRIVDVVESCIPVDSILSIDEMICRLTGSQRNVTEAMALSQKIKRAVQEKIGAFMKSSIGLAPNRFLAKVASDFQKPNGLTVFQEQDLPQKLYSLELSDFPGIGGQMESRLHREGIKTVQQLCQLSLEDMRRVWGGVTGERFWGWLRGQEPPLPPSHRYSIGHSHVLPPEQRNAQGLYQVAKRLTHKAAIRLRKDNFWTSGMSLAIRFLDKQGWEGRASFSDTQDTPRFLKALEELWVEVPRQKPVWIGVTLYPLIAENRHTPSLFDNPKQEKLSAVMDAINDKYGNDTAYFASLQDTLRQAPTRIAFSRIPDLKEF